MFTANLLRAVVVLHLVWVGGAAAFPVVPDPDLTQGDLCSRSDRDFTHLRYKQQIPYCERNVDYDRRSEIYEAYKINPKCRHRFTIDHFIPLSIGGNNSDQNLWPEHKLVKETRPYLEEEVFKAVQSGQMNQAEAIRIITEEKTKARAQILKAYGKGGCDQPQGADDLVVGN
jgi:hypothetical protein